MGKASKQEKKDTTKSIEERKVIVEGVKAKFADIGIDVDNYEPLSQLKQILNEYESIENIVSGYSGKIFVPEMKRYVEYRLPIKKQSIEMLKLCVS
jgi:hypothetical protein